LLRASTLLWDKLSCERNALRNEDKEENVSVFGGRILLATDGSPEAERALGTAAMLSEKLGAELHLVCVEPMPDPLSWPEARIMSPELRGDIRERAEDAAREVLDGQAEKLGEMGGEASGIHAAAGPPDAEIVRLAEEVGAGLVVIGSRGLGPVRRAVMGGVSHSVVHHSHGSVLVVRGEDGLPGRILLAVDGSEQARTAAEAAAEISASTGSNLHVVFVMPTAAHLYGHHLYSREMRESVREEAEDDVRAFLDEQVGWIEARGGEVEDSHMAVGRPDAEIVKLAEELGAGLTVVGSRGLGGVRRALVGSVSDSVVRHAHGPVLVVRGEGEASHEASENMGTTG
jgi:nucleotide-binding universal stress UspA family protein